MTQRRQYSKYDIDLGAEFCLGTCSFSDASKSGQKIIPEIFSVIPKRVFGKSLNVNKWPKLRSYGLVSYFLNNAVNYNIIVLATL